MTLCGMPYEEHDDYSILWDERVVRARKKHRCDECGSAIEPRERYGRAKALGDGCWNSWARCGSCLVLAELVGTLTGECGLWGGLCDYIDRENEERQWKGEEPILDPVENRALWDKIDRQEKGESDG